MLNFYNFPKIAFTLIFLCLFALQSKGNSQACSNLNIQEILQKIDQAIDPYNKGDSIKSFEINSKTKISKYGDFELDYQMIFKSPNKFRSKVTLFALDVIIIFNGQEGYLISPLFGRKKLPQKEVSSTMQQIQFMNVATKYSKLFEKVKVMENLVTIDNRKCYEIQGFLPNYFSNMPLTLYVDCENYYIRAYSLEIAAQNKQAVIKVLNRNFTEFDGIFIAKESSSQAGQTKAVNNIQSVNFNIEIDDKIFEISNY